MSNTGIVLETLKRIDLLQELPDQVLMDLSSISHLQRFERNDYIALQGHSSGNIYLVHSGTLKVVSTDEDGREYIHNVIGEGYVLPGRSLFSHESLPASIRSLTDSTVLTLSQEKFEEIVLDYPHVLKQLIVEMNRRIYRLHDWQQKLAVCDSNQKMMSLLGRLADEYGKYKADGIHIRLPITQQEMAQIIGIRRESLNRMWTRLQKKSVVVSKNNEWVLSNAWQSELLV